ncbi:MAG: DNA-directed RNA polymerase subunit beta' [Patescibacteria group bacterium]
MKNNKVNNIMEDFNAVSLKLASPERIRAWSYGEVTKPETINYRSGRSERNGLFDERIFGPEKDYECYCGKYKRVRYKDIVCEKCGVEVTRSIVRRERMGHIDLACPVSHIWFVRNIPSRLGILLNLTITDVEKVIYFAGYIITDVDDVEKTKVLKQLDNEYKTKVKAAGSDKEKEAIKQALLGAKRQLESIEPWRVIDEIEYHRLSLKYGQVFEAGIGAEALNQICQGIDLEDLLSQVSSSLETAKSTERIKLRKRYNLVKSMLKAGVRPEWMLLKVVPIIPPALRPMVALDGGRHATSDINDLYRRVINRNNRLKKLIDLNAPEVILRNEKRILQEAVDALIDNNIRKSGGEGVMNQSQRRPLKSLADNLRGKQGRFRQNLIGKRVDYSGRSVIVVGPDLKISQCGLPKLMALELFRPFIIAQILEKELAFNIRGAGRLIDEQSPDIWAILEDVIKDKYVLLNRPPTLHRLGIQAFQPVLIEGSAIQIHPLVCSAFNADFDGDQMAVHVPLSVPAQKEARDLVAANRNLLKPGSGDPVINMKLDIVLGCYWVTKEIADARGSGQYFSSPNHAIMAHDFDHVDLQAKINVKMTKKEKYGEYKEKIIETSVGRLLFNNNLPADFPFFNQAVTGKGMSALVDQLVHRYDMSLMPDILDKIKSFGFKYATTSGITWGIDDVVVPAKKEDVIKKAQEETIQIYEQYNDGLLSDNERYQMFIETWLKARNEVEKLVPGSLGEHKSVSDMLNSNARGSVAQVTQMSGMIGLMTNPSGQLIDFPIVSSFKEGLTPLEFFVSTHGSRKGLADTALNTAQAGYLTRKLVYVAQDIIVNADDCQDKQGKVFNQSHILGFEEGLANSIRGRILLESVKDQNGQELFPDGHLLSKADAKSIDEAGITEVRVRTPLTCKNTRGICRACYGEDQGRGGLIKIGEPVGVVAAQAIGEPGTQLTMRTKHAGGVSQEGGDIVGGLPRVTEIFERRNPKASALLSEVEGEVMEIKVGAKDRTIVILTDPAVAKDKKKKSTVEYTVPAIRNLLIEKGDTITVGQILTDGSVDLVNYLKLAGQAKVEDYIIKEINAIYQLQGVDIARKHIELVIRQMLSRRKIQEPGDTDLQINEVVDKAELEEVNTKVKAEGGEPAKGKIVILGISDVALSSSSFLSAASFQHTTKVLINAAVAGKVDKLRGLKENVALGRLIPAGTGLIPDYNEIAEAEAENGSIARMEDDN